MCVCVPVPVCFCFKLMQSKKINIIIWFQPIDIKYKFSAFTHITSIHKCIAEWFANAFMPFNYLNSPNQFEFSAVYAPLFAFLLFPCCLCTVNCTAHIPHIVSMRYTQSVWIKVSQIQLCIANELNTTKMRYNLTHTHTHTILKAKAHNVKVLSQHLELQLTNLAVHKIGIFGIDRQNSFSCKNKQTNTFPLSLPLALGCLLARCTRFACFSNTFPPAHSISPPLNQSMSFLHEQIFVSYMVVSNRGLFMLLSSSIE